MIGLDEVKLWSVFRSVGCVVTSTRGGWVTTACGSLRTGSGTEARPRRVCRACREALPRLTRAS